MTLPVEQLGALRVGPRPLVAGNREGPLAGLNFVAKDVFDVAGERTGAGNPTWLAEAQPATRSAEVVEVLVGAGATCIGKSHTDEFAFSLGGDNAHYGTPFNAAAPGCATGGSSSGSASAVAAGVVPFALGTDTGGSVRVPASYCGLVGLRPTHGCISTRGLVPLARSFDTVGWLAADLDIARRVGEVLLPPDTVTAPRQAALLTDVERLVSARVWDSFAAAARAWAERAGMPLAEVALQSDPAEWLDTFRTLQTSEAFAEHGAWIAAHPGALSSAVAERFHSGSLVKPDRRAAATARREELRAELADVLAETVVLVPSAPTTATPLDASAEMLAAVRPATLQLTCYAGIAAVPGLSLPLARVGGRPLGVCLLGPAGSDRSLLELTAPA